MNVIMPQLGETVAEGKIGTWFKSVGDAVKAGDNLFEIETDKVSMEVQATEEGVLAEIKVAAGETVPVGTVVAVLADAGYAPEASKPEAPKPEASKKDATKKEPAKAAAPKAPAMAVAATPSRPVPAAPAMPRPSGPLSPFEEVRTPRDFYGKATAPQGLKITPLARRLVHQSGIDLAVLAESVRARGGNRIAARDVKSAPPATSDGRAASISTRAPLQPRPGDTIEPLNRIRLQTAQHLATAWREAPHVFQAVEVEFSTIDAARQTAKRAFQERFGVALTYLPFIARAVCLALAEFPRVNASFDQTRLLIHRGVNLGIATDLDHAGLLVPVVHHADEMTAGGLAKAIARQVEKAKTGKLAPGDLEGGTYTITNNGSFGTSFTAAIINVPQVAILSTDAIRKRAIAIETPQGDAVAIRPVGTLGQSFDHRAFDGAYSAAYLRRLKEICETRDWAPELV
jgi:2-oxoglutarate dehydrogenase E2 component (dihydrolipoamide succinyltransferase)